MNLSFVYRLCFGLFLISLILYALVAWQKKETPEAATTLEDFHPAYVAEDLKTSMYNSEGVLTHQVIAKRMEHYKSLEFTHFEFPEYILHPKDNSPAWHLSSNEAVLYKDNRIVLEDRVRVLATDNDSLILEVHGNYLQLDLTTNIVSSEQTIMIIGQGFTMYGSGLTLDLNTKEMKLKQHVRTVYKRKIS